MTRFEKFWAGIVAKTPGFGGDDSVKVTITLGSFRKFVKRAHNDGFVAGVDVEKTTKTKADSFGDMFSGFFRK